MRNCITREHYGLARNRKEGTKWCPVDVDGCVPYERRMGKKYLSLKERATYHSLEDVIGCKWSVGVVAAIGEGIRRPGELERYIPGISKKILNERLRKLTAYGLIERSEFPGAVMHVEYALTPMGRKLAGVLEQLQVLGREHREMRPS